MLCLHLPPGEKKDDIHLSPVGGVKGVHSLPGEKKDGIPPPAGGQRRIVIVPPRGQKIVLH